MKKLRLPIIVAIVATVIVPMSLLQTSCTKAKKSTVNTDTLSSASIASSISSLVSSSGGGLGSQAEANAQMYQSMSFICGQIIDTNFSGVDTFGGMTIKYNYKNADTAFCSGGSLTSVDFTFSGFSDMSMTNMYFGGSTNTFMSLGGLSVSATNYTVNENGSATDTLKETSPSTLNYYCKLSYSASNIVISKATGLIVSGTESIQYSYTTSNGNNYNVTATITFQGNSTALITLANGYSTTVTW